MLGQSGEATRAERLGDADPKGRPGRDWVNGGVSAVASAGFVLAYLAGLVYNFFIVALLFGPVALVAARLWRARRGELRWRWWRSDRRVPHLLQALNFMLFWGLLAAVMAPAPINVQFGVDEHRLVVGLLVGGGAVMAVSGLVPRARLSLALNVVAAIGTVWVGAQLWRVHTGPAGPVRLAFPLDGDWYVMHGGRSSLYNHHFHVPAQRHALDLVRVEARRTRDETKDGLDRYLAFGQVVRAPSDGRVTAVEAALPDQRAGTSTAVRRQATTS